MLEQNKRSDYSSSHSITIIHFSIPFILLLSLDLRENMSELCLLNTPKTTQFSTLLLSDLILLFSLILSHPLYFSYLVFFSPYLLKLLSFLSPLFVTTSLLLLSFLPVSPSLLRETSFESSESESKVSFLLSIYCSVLERLRSKTDEEDTEFHQSVGLEVYKIVFHTSALYGGENSDEVPQLRSEENTVQAMEAPVVLKSSRYEGSCESKSEVLVANVEEKTVEVAWEEIKTTPILKELEEFENMNCKVEEKEVEVPGFKSDQVEATKGDESNPRRFDANANNSDNGGEHTPSKFLESPNLKKLDSNLGRYVSVRKEKDWKRTLACKLLEERHNVDGGEEGMDLLWETYEMDSSNKVKPKSKTTNKKKKKKKKKTKSELECYDDDDDDNEGEELDGQSCCLQALKLSAGKRDLGMGKISKAIKGIGWLHSVTRHCKKVYY